MDRFVYISSADNEKVRLYRRLGSERKLRRKEKLFTAEGARLVSDAAAEGAGIRYILLTESAMERYNDTAEMLAAKYGEKKIYLISEDLAAALSDTQMPQGIFAVCENPALDKSEVYGKIKHGGRYLILDNIQDPGNMGTMLRTADACGIDAVITCGCCDIYNPKTVRSAMGSLMRVDIIDDSFENAVLSFKNADIPVFAAVINNGTSLTECDFSGGAAVVIGNEGNGISEEHCSICSERLTIKMNGTINSLNAAMAAGIIMWELSK